MKTIGCWILITAFILNGNGCRKHDSPNEEDLKWRVYRLIDDDREDEAILLLEDEIARRDLQDNSGKDHSPVTMEYRTILASAYAKKAGLNFKVFIRSFSLIKQSQEMMQWNLKWSESSFKSEEKSDEISLTLMRTLFQIQNLERALTAIPEVSKDKAYYLEKSFVILSGVPDLREANKVYFALLHLVKIKRIIYQEIRPKISRLKYCEPFFTLLRDDLLLVLELSTKLLDLIMKVQTKEKSKIEELKNKIQSLVPHVRSLQTEVIRTQLQKMIDNDFWPQILDLFELELEEDCDY